MPTLEQVRQFEKTLVKLGAEPEILAERGEEVEAVAPPGEGISADLQDLLAPPEPGHAPPRAAKAAPLEDMEPLDSLDLGAFGITDEPGGETPGADAGETAAPGPEDFAVPEGLFGGLDLPEGTEPQDSADEAEAALDLPADTEAPSADDFALPETAEAPSADDFALPEGADLPSADDFALPEGADLPSADDFALPESADLPSADDFALPESADLPSADDFALPESADLPSADDFALPESAEPEAPAPGEEPAADFELPEGMFEDLAEAEAAPSEPAEAEPAAEPAGLEMPEMADMAEEVSFDEGAGTGETPQFDLPHEPAQGGAQEPAPGAEDDDFVIDEFSLPGMDEIEEPAAAPSRAPGAAAQSGPGPGPEAPSLDAYPTEQAPAEYTEEEFERIRETLASLPLSLRVSVEEAIGAGALPQDAVRRLVDLLIDGASAADIARALSQATGVRVSLPRGGQKGTGIAFERERGSIGYLLRKSVIPALQVLVPAAGLLVGLALAANEQIIKPWKANNSYREAVTQIAAGRYDAAERSFDSATALYPMLRWFWRTADAYRSAGQYDRAGDIYERVLGDRPLLGGKLLTPDDKRRDDAIRARMRLGRSDRRTAVLAYANMKSYESMDYPGAEALLKKHLSQPEELGDYAAILALGDNYIEWAAEEPSHYSQAEEAYRKAIREQSPATDEPILRMLRYYARTGKVKDVERLVEGFEKQKKPKLDPQIYSEAAGALMDGGKFDVARKVLGRAYDLNPKLPETAFQYSRFFRWADDGSNEERALNLAIEQLDAIKRLTPRATRQAILARNALGELYNRRNEPLTAQKHFTEAIGVLEKALADKRIKPAADLGVVYSNSADVHYYNDRDLKAALALYEKARGLGAATDNVLYKIGYIHYDREDYQGALVELHKVADKEIDNPSALFALGNTLYLRGDYLAAQGYYTLLVRQLESRRQRIAVLQPQANAAHRDLLELTMRTFNNLGVTEKRVSEDARLGGRETRANFYLQRSIEFYDQLQRNADTLVHSAARNLGFINSRILMYPRAGAQMEIYRDLPKDLGSYRLN